MSVLDTLITNREQGATYDHTDINRVYAAMKYVSDWLSALGLSTSVSLRSYTRTDIPTYSMFDHLTAQLSGLVAAVKSRLPLPVHVPVCGSPQHYVTVADANTIEDIILQLEESAETLEGQRAWLLRIDPATGDLIAYYTGDVEPQIDFYLDDNGDLYAAWPDGVPEPEFDIDELGNVNLIYLEGE